MKNPILDCNICGKKSEHQIFDIPEMQLGLRDTFCYIKCSYCGSLKLDEIPPDLSKYYPPYYYSYQISHPSRLKNFIKKIRAKSALGYGFHWMRPIFIKIFGIPPFVNWIHDLDLEYEDSILDVGSGSGFVLQDMANAGFKNLVGIDPFIKEDINQNDQIRITKASLDKISSRFKLIMFNHSLEHIKDVVGILQNAKEKLIPGGVILIRIPVIDTFAWKKYGAHWVQIDAPRHFFVPSVKAVQLLAKRTGLHVFNIKFDSNEFQFYGSEQYQRGIPLVNPQSRSRDPDKSLFTKHQIIEYRRWAAKLNEEGMGDQACFYLRLES